MNRVFCSRLLAARHEGSQHRTHTESFQKTRRLDAISENEETESDSPSLPIAWCIEIPNILVKNQIIYQFIRLWFCIFIFRFLWVLKLMILISNHLLDFRFWLVIIYLKFSIPRLWFSIWDWSIWFFDNSIPRCNFGVQTVPSLDGIYIYGFDVLLFLMIILLVLNFEWFYVIENCQIDWIDM